MPRQGVMLCYPFSEKRLESWGSLIIVQPKLDGVRCVYRDNKLISSEGNEIVSVPHINRELAFLKERGLSLSCFLGEYAFDGELYIHGLSHQSLMSMVGRHKNIVENKVQYHLFDASCKHEQAYRIGHLHILDIVTQGLGARYVRILPTFTTDNSIQLVRDYLATFISAGYEGIIIRRYNGLYKEKRSTDIMKLKLSQIGLFRIVGIKEEISKDGVPKGRLGAFLCGYAPAIPTVDGYLSFGVGTGFSAEERQDIWDTMDKYVGRVIKVKYQNLTEAGVPRFPVFAGFHEDKEE